MNGMNGMNGMNEMNEMSRGWLTKDAFLVIVGVWFLLLALNHARI
jgi:hypothetical protein